MRRPELLGASLVTLAQRQLGLILSSLAALSPRMLARCTFAASSAASPAIAGNSRFAARVSAHGQLLAEARVILHKKVDQLDCLFDRPIAARRYFPRLGAGVYDKPAVDELVLCPMDNILITDSWIGLAELSFPEAHGEEIELWGPIKVGCGCRFTLSFSVSDNEILADLAV